MSTKSHNKYKCFLIIVGWLLFFSNLPTCEAAKFTLYEATDLGGAEPAKITFYDGLQGRDRSLAVERYNNSCYNFESDWNDQISSVNTNGNCIIAWDAKDCGGQSKRIAPGTSYHGNLKGIDFDNVISSFNICPTVCNEGEEDKEFCGETDCFQYSGDEFYRCVQKTNPLISCPCQRQPKNDSKHDEYKFNSSKASEEFSHTFIGIAIAAIVIPLLVLCCLCSAGILVVLYLVTRRGSRSATATTTTPNPGPVVPTVAAPPGGDSTYNSDANSYASSIANDLNENDSPPSSSAQSLVVSKKEKVQKHKS